VIGDIGKHQLSHQCLLCKAYVAVLKSTRNAAVSSRTTKNIREEIFPRHCRPSRTGTASNAVVASGVSPHTLTRQHQHEETCTTEGAEVVGHSWQAQGVEGDSQAT